MLILEFLVRHPAEDANKGNAGIHDIVDKGTLLAHLPLPNVHLDNLFHLPHIFAHDLAHLLREEQLQLPIVQVVVMGLALRVLLEQFGVLVHEHAIVVLNHLVVGGYLV
jgi:hypothetical protein